MLRLNGNQDEQIKSEYRRFRNSSAGVRLTLENHKISHLFKTEAAAENFINWLTLHQFITEIDIGTVGRLAPFIETRNGMSVFVVTLSQDIIDRVLGKGHYENEALVSLQQTFATCVDSGRIAKIHLLMRTPFFSDSPTFQQRFLETRNDYGHSILETAVRQFDEAELKQFVSAFDHATLQQAMLTQNGEHKNVLAVAMIHTFNASFAHLLAHAIPETLETAVSAHPEMLEELFQYQASQTILAFLNKQVAWKEIQNKMTPRIASQLMDYLRHEPEWNNREASQMVHEMVENHLSFPPEEKKMEISEEKYSPAFDNIQALIAEEHALLQKVPLMYLHETLLTLTDYNHRDPLSLPHHPDTKLYRFDHMTNTILAYDPLRDEETGEYKHTKALPMIHLSSQLNHAIPGENDSHIPQVYLLHDKRQGNIKAMLTKSHQTRHAKWIGTFDEVEDYAENEGRFSKTDFAEFNQAAKAKSHRLNKVLFETTQEAVTAIVIARDSVIDRMTARYAVTTFHTAGLSLPVIFYDRALREIRHYSVAEMENDHALAADKFAKIDSLAKLDALNPVELEFVMLHQSDMGHKTSFELTLSNFRDEALPLLNKLRPKAINAMLTRQKDLSPYILLLAAEHLPANDFNAFVSHLANAKNTAAMFASLIKQDDQGRSALMLAAERQTPQEFTELFRLCPQYRLNAAAKVEYQPGQSLLNVMLDHHHIESAVSVLNQIDDEAFDFLFYRNEVAATLVDHVCNELMKTPPMLSEAEEKQDDASSQLAHQQSFWQDSAFITRLLQHERFRVSLIEKLDQHWSDGKEPPITVLKHVQEALLRQSPQALSSSLAEIAQHRHPEDKTTNEEKQDSFKRPNIFMTSQNNPILLNVSRIVTLQLIWSEGLSSWQDYRLLRQQYGHINGMIDVLDNLKKADCVLKGLLIPFQEGNQNAQTLQEANARARLLGIKQKIESSSLSKFMFFPTSTKPATVQLIQSHIENAETAAESWTDAATHIAKAVAEAEKNDTWQRYQETRDFYAETKSTLSNRRPSN